MPNQFQDRYTGLDTQLIIELQADFGTYQVVDSSDPGMFWGGFKSYHSARRYARLTLGAKNIVCRCAGCGRTSTLMPSERHCHHCL